MYSGKCVNFSGKIRKNFGIIKIDPRRFRRLRQLRFQFIDWGSQHWYLMRFHPPPFDILHWRTFKRKRGRLFRPPRETQPPMTPKVSGSALGRAGRGFCKQEENLTFSLNLADLLVFRSLVGRGYFHFRMVMMKSSNRKHPRPTLLASSSNAAAIRRTRKERSLFRRLRRKGPEKNQSEHADVPRHLPASRERWFADN